jgi:hypothetical protein
MPVQGVALPSGELLLVFHIAGLSPAAQAESLPDVRAEFSRFPGLSASFPTDLILVSEVAGRAAGHGVIAWTGSLEHFPAVAAALALILNTFRPDFIKPSVAIRMPIKRISFCPGTASFPGLSPAAQAESLP